MNDAEARIQLTRIGRQAERLSKTILSDPIPMTLRVAFGTEALSVEQAKNLDYRTIKVGEKWGERWDLAWFHALVEIPESHTESNLVVRLDLGGEGLVFDSDGSIIQGISSGSVFAHDFHRDVVHLEEKHSKPGRLEFWIEASACGLFGLLTEADPAPNSPRRYGHFDAKVVAAELCRFDRERWALWLDIETVRGMLTGLPESSVRHARLLEETTRALDAYYRTGSVAECRELLACELNRPASSSSPAVFAVGHAHIDTAWLWPVRETVRKCARTFASQLKLIDECPNYVFGASQPQHYQFVKERYPELYARIGEAVRAGRWELQGGMWVEADCNIISGESMIRQILHGKNFFRDEFGVDVNNLWLPDVFGYSPALPQILKRSGIDYFVTQKISWNQYNKFPHHTFRWQGIDGSRVLAHFPPEDNYNSSLRPESLIGACERFAERGRVDQFLSLFGVGDGGGGPKEEHIEFGRRAANTEGLPRLRMAGAGPFFEQVQKQADRLATWSGELYLELHRGTLTTQAHNKRWNRKLENRLRETEDLFSCLPLDDYPTKELDRLWKTLLLNQFHDILPGSSINEVYRVTEEEYSGMAVDLDDLQRQAAERLFEPDDNSVVVFNPTSYRYSGPVRLPEGWPSVHDKVCQVEQNGSHADVTIPPHSFLDLSKGTTAAKPVEDRETILENDLIRYIFDDRAGLVEIFDKECARTVSLAGQPGNLLTLYEDRPNDWDAWDIDRTYERTDIESQRAEATAHRLSGPVRQTLTYSLQLGASAFSQEIILTPQCKRLDFVTNLNWQESHKMLRVSFPVDIRSEEAGFDIQYGYIKRPTHRNNSWDLARFEVVAHRYADLSEPDYGVAILNDSKYGHKVLGQTLDLCLLRAPSYPDPDADRGEQVFTYSLLPHSGDLIRSDVMAQAAALNQPPLVLPGLKTTDATFPVMLEGDGVTLETVKKAERENCHVIRLVETNGCHSQATLTLNGGFTQVQECDLMEWKTVDEPMITPDLTVKLKPFEIRTFKVK